MKVEFDLKAPSIKGIKNAVGSALTKSGNAVLNAKTPSLREIGNAADKAQKKARHTLADLIDPKQD